MSWFMCFILSDFSQVLKFTYYVVFLIWSTSWQNQAEEKPTQILIEELAYHSSHEKTARFITVKNWDKSLIPFNKTVQVMD